MGRAGGCAGTLKVIENRCFQLIGALALARTRTNPVTWVPASLDGTPPRTQDR